MSATMVWQAVQIALYTNLKLNTTFMAACGNRIYEQVPQGTLYPLSVLRTSSQEDGDKTQPGERISVEVHSWSQYRGQKEIMAITAAAYKALHNQPAMARSVDVQTSMLVYIDTISFIEPDGLTQHAVSRYFTRSQSPIQA